MITDNIIKFKILEDFDATETNSSNVNIYFPFVNERSTFNRYRAQLFYPISETITSISICVAKGGDFPSYDLPIGIYKYENDVNTNYGIDNPNNLIISALVLTTSAAGKSILLTTGIIVKSCSKAR